MVATTSFKIYRGAKFYKVFQTTYENEDARTLVGKKIRAVIKESSATSTILFNLTEANQGVEVINDSLGDFALFIPADETNIDVDFAILDIFEEDEVNPELNRKLLQAQIEFIKGTKNG